MIAKTVTMAGFWTFFFSALCFAGPEEFQVKRREVFAFTAKPEIQGKGDQVKITFTVQDYCDATVVIEDGQGKIIRHLGSGVLGDKAPAPFQKNSLRQMIVWDGKDDLGRYVDDKDRHEVRVSLGLKPQLEKVLFWEPKIRSGQEASCLQAAPEGVYVYDGRVFDQVRLFDHDGTYRRTVYPFPADKVRQAKGLNWHTFPQDGGQLPLKEGFHQATLLNSGTNAGFDPKLGFGIDLFHNYHGAVWGNAASAMAVRGERLALARLRLNRLATDGSTGGLNLTGPEVFFALDPKTSGRRKEVLPIPPRSAAFSPDGQWLYLTGYVTAFGEAATRDIVLIKAYDWLPGVVRMRFDGEQKPEVFLGSMKLAEAGSDSTHFKTPTSVAVDSAGRLYVSDFGNDRIQIFSPEGKFLKTIASEAPAQVVIQQRTQEIYVFSWHVPESKPARKAAKTNEGKLTVFRSFDEPRVVLSCPLPLGPAPDRGSGLSFRAEVDAWAAVPTIWLVAEWSRLDYLSRDRVRNSNITLHTLENGQLKLKRDFNQDVAQSVARTKAPEYFRQRLHVDPVTGLLYVAEGQAASGKSFQDIVRIDPDTGEARIVQLPFDAEDMCIGIDGLAYLRSFYLVARYEPRTWREVPFDYGEEHDKVRTSSSGDVRHTQVASAIRLPVKMAGLHHHGGMAVSPWGHLVVAVNNYGTQPTNRKDVYEVPANPGGKPYTPPVFPGRVRWGEVHVWDRHGQMLYEDAVPGLNRLDGMGIDKDDNLYLLANPTRILEGQRYFNDMTGTVIKVKPGKAKVLSASDRAAVPLPETSRPNRPPDVVNAPLGQAWVEGAEWFYGGVGFFGRNAARAGSGCDCYNARLSLDYLGRTFAPEVDHCSVAVLDTAGNLILRVGRYGNADSAGPQSAVPLGGDEVGLFYAPYLATQTDRRLFIADAGNGRILTVKLDYHRTEKLPLRSISSR